MSSSNCSTCNCPYMTLGLFVAATVAYTAWSASSSKKGGDCCGGSNKCCDKKESCCAATPAACCSSQSAVVPAEQPKKTIQASYQVPEVVLPAFQAEDLIDGHTFSTAVVHAGCELDSRTGYIIPPICLTTTFAQSFPGVRPGKDDPNSHGMGYFYSRAANPTRGALERALAQLDHGKHCCVFASGLAATSTVISLLSAGDHAVVLDDLYGGTSSYFRDVAAITNGIQFTFTDMGDAEAVDKLCTPKTKMIWLESPTNPLLKTTDIRAIAAVAKKNGCILVVDGTFQSPYLQNPLLLGADIVVHSVTKYIAGHSDVLMGAAIANREDIIKRLIVLQEKIGAVPSPFECYLTLRGLKTLGIRMEAAQRNAMGIAKFLKSHPLIEKVIYPGLEDYEYYHIAKSQTKGPGAMISIHIKGGLPVAGKFLQSLKVFSLAVSLGAVESLACSPAIMTHAAVPVEKREAIGLTDSLIRLSIGIENLEDLIRDMAQALAIAQDLYNSQASK